MLRITSYTHLLLLIFTLLFFSCKQEEVAPSTSKQKAFSDVNSAKEATGRLYKVGLPKLYFDTDAEEGVTLACGYLVANRERSSHGLLSGIECAKA